MQKLYKNGKLTTLKTDERGRRYTKESSQETRRRWNIVYEYLQTKIFQKKLSMYFTDASTSGVT
ncbi:hypothetical protein HMPREF1544_01243 [Mucor circinelloides 1006PhL]|uniref:Uncharacterized protein n=1 Tax=Mucor circinelloides f. circinelloides (strain 1006PhL) TaxID=1220926 RepID=S2JPT3_MUCC1|nr:hypothetical protein HMPREF1544_01243 [Mucor circinelloides 1006PhL]